MYSVAITRSARKPRVVGQTMSYRMEYQRCLSIIREGGPDVPVKLSGRKYEFEPVVARAMALEEKIGLLKAPKIRSIGRLKELGIEMIGIPAGLFPFQRTRVMFLPEFGIGKTPVTNAQYLQFLLATGHRDPEYWRHKGFGITTSRRSGELLGLNLPVVGVSFSDAEAFAQWAGARLPTEFEWEKAARGRKGYIFPWGNYLDSQDRCVFGTDRTQPVDRDGVERGNSPYGVLDMSGNVWEWTSSMFGSGRRGAEHRVLRGGAWIESGHDDPGRPYHLRVDSRVGGNPEDRHNYFGIRLAA